MRPALLLLSPPSCWHYVPSSRCAAAQVPPFLAPLSSPASCSSTHTHNTQVPASSMPHPAARATIPRLVRALFAASASASTPAAGTPLHSLSAEHAAARSPSALEGPVTRATHRHPLLLPRPLCANAAPHRCSRSACSAVCQAHASHPHSTVQTSLVPVRHLTINTSLFFCFCFP